MSPHPQLATDRQLENRAYLAALMAVIVIVLHACALSSVFNGNAVELFPNAEVTILIVSALLDAVGLIVALRWLGQFAARGRSWPVAVIILALILATPCFGLDFFLLFISSWTHV